MKHFSLYISFAFYLIFSAAAQAQNTAWIQIEAQPSLIEAQNRARAYGGVFSNVNGFSLGSGWYAIALGPFSADAAETRRVSLRRENLIPRDSFIADGSKFRQQFWPIGANANAPVQTEPAAAAMAIEAPEPQVATIAPLPFGETIQEARRSERSLDRADRELLQTALQWEGFYASAIDGAFGAGTRNAMAAYQAANGFEATGVLTTKQRSALLAAYESVLAGLGLRTVRDEAAYIEVMMPTALVEFSRYEPPFAQYNSKDDSGVRVLLISQTGGKGALFGLYDIMQTLEIVPLEGPREIGANSFVLTGANDTIQSYTYAALNGGLIKGFSLIWPAGDKKRFDRVVQELRASFTPFGKLALDETLGGAPEDQAIDLLSGLELQRPEISRSGFFISANGLVMTTTDVLQECKRIVIDEEYDAEVVLRDADLGIAILKPKDALAPFAHATFQTAVPRLQADVALAGYSYGGVLNAPTMSFGTLADIRGLNGDETVQRLDLAALENDAGGPVMDATGSVMGVLKPLGKGDRQLPEGVSFATKADRIAKALSAQGIELSFSENSTNLDPEDLTTLGTDMTVLVSCWDD